MEGFWTLQFQGAQGIGAGVLFLSGGRVLGGDSGFLYNGTFSHHGDRLTILMNVKRFVRGMPSSMGREEFDLELTGLVQGSEGKLEGSIPGTFLKFSAVIAKQSDLPQSSGKRGRPAGSRRKPAQSTATG